MSDVKFWTLVVFYLVGMLLTNAYCREFRYEVWLEIAKIDGTAFIRLVLATVLWPVYWASYAASSLVLHLANLYIAIGK